MMHGLQNILLVYVLRCLGQIVHGSDIINGKKAPENSMQYVVSVQNIDGHMCGGFLVTEDFVVTAAHCDVENPTHVVLGSHNIKKGYQINIEKKFKHPSYSNIWLGNDIMLLKLSRKAQLGCKVQIIQLPCAEMNLKAGEVCQVAGWGKNRTGGENVDDLRVVSVSVINQYVCREQWPGLSANVICAGGYGTNKGFCQGDSGAPLVCNGLVVGLASFNKNYNCAYPDVPNIYTDISKYLKWINGILLTATSS
ncbi:trypsin [Oreochromis niloticus]|uniref:Duodenase-1-like n=1 Tax=Oreochromis niloticus TaxID=8128 RepID=A0A669DZM9_ORENI|nr:trypsin [Oreochromis niloticus]